ncbi:hypothetical protein JXO52_14195 [bacterium]|nr:hypothetical protein [bacterium]
MPGQAGNTLGISGKIMYINGREDAEPWRHHIVDRVLAAATSPRDSMVNVCIPANRYFVLGDNRDNSLDSRYCGCHHHRCRCFRTDVRRHRGRTRTQGSYSRTHRCPGQ